MDKLFSEISEHPSRWVCFRFSLSMSAMQLGINRRIPVLSSMKSFPLFDMTTPGSKSRISVLSRAAFSRLCGLNGVIVSLSSGSEGLPWQHLRFFMKKLRASVAMSQEFRQMQQAPSLDRTWYLTKTPNDLH